MAKRRAKKPLVVPPKGAPSNLRPAGAHKDLRERPRAEQQREALEDQVLPERAGGEGGEE